MKVYTEFKNCIICLQSPIDSHPLTILTDEHIVSEFLGGNITVKNVCKGCNDKLGHKLEGPLSNNIFFRLYTYTNKIKGKKNLLANPLSGIYTSNGRTFRFENDFSLYQIPIINHHLTIDGNLAVNVSIDKKDIDTIDQEIFKNISRKLKKDGKPFKEDELKQAIKQDIQSNKLNIKAINQPEIDVSFPIDFDQIALLALKTGYELIAWISGESLIFSDDFNKIRSSLINIELDKDIKYRTDDFYKIFKETIKSNPYFKIENLSRIDNIFRRNKTIVVLIHGGLFVRITNLWFSFQMPDLLKQAFLIFTSDSATGEFNFYTEYNLL